ncbi:hypothetical protein HN419_00490 [Candidatus Woesearchaeota archaeon]|jgi:hypothetical protein|nr:hypothetical protein [Candidatus Woesearchaeota archaeon]MBT3537525.1 hypothetical protein [Candidatus Woesearchaeota archaeon]MBT4696829.1 hypothetical protein [Candidatus Woesearchaeota archaeon]MBT4717650.1 hypothetical protein [Candidatus Woesearchaeota archaeon]MBT7106165.1 hypothetical protein [Candidatus Woesearchaeota archaeon]
MISIRKLKWQNIFKNYEFATLLTDKERGWVNHLVEKYNYGDRLPEDILINRSVLQLLYVLHCDVSRFQKITKPLVDDLDETIYKMQNDRDHETVRHYTEILGSLAKLRDAGDIIDENIDVVLKFHAKESRDKTYAFDEMARTVLHQLNDKHSILVGRIRDIS